MMEKANNNRKEVTPHQSKGSKAEDPNSGATKGNHVKKANRDGETDFRYFYSGKKLL